MDALQIVAEPRRRQILAMVWDNELPVTEIASRFDISLAAISQHLSILKQAEMVTMRKDGNRHLYSANHGALETFKPILESMWGSMLGDLAKTIEAEQGEESG